MKRYYVTTYDSEREAFTPQKGVRTGPYTLFGLRRALRALRAMCYDATRLPRRQQSYKGKQWLEGCGDPSVYVEARVRA